MAINLQRIRNLVQQQKIVKAVSELEQNEVRLGKEFYLSIKKNFHLTDPQKNEAALLIKNTLFENDKSSLSEILPFLKKKYFSQPDNFNFIIQQNGRIVALSQVCGLQDKALVLCLTVVAQNKTIPIRGRGFYRLFMSFKFLFALAYGYPYVIGRTQNPLALEQYDKHGLFYAPILYYKLHDSKSAKISIQKSHSLVAKAIEIYKQYTGVEVGDNLMIDSEQVDTAAYTATKQLSGNEIINKYVKDNIRNAQRILAIRRIKKTAIKEILHNINMFSKKTSMKDNDR